MYTPKNNKNTQRQQLRNDKAYLQAIKQFLTNFKTNLCEDKNPHDINFCHYYHTTDQRRNPYHQNSFAYYPNLQALQEIKGQDFENQSMICLNRTQLYYHPIVYKTQRCPNYYQCPNGLYCTHLHHQDQLAFEYGEFFRFNIDSHKTKPCPKRQNHERKTCIYYHNMMDKRRPQFSTYSHQLCTQSHCKDEQCPLSHNKIEQVYHPTRYKTKFCKSYINKALKCQYKQFCGFAHSQSQIKVEMIHLLARDHEFFLTKYKTVWCPDTLNHDRSICVYAHNIQDFRRDPFAPPYYDAQKCLNWNFEDQLKSIDDSGCNLGMECPKCHGWMEQKYHPQVYKKSKFTENKQVSSILDKKLNNIPKEGYKQKNSGNARGISSVVQDKINEHTKMAPTNNMHNSGAPYFRKQVVSDSSRRSKALTTNIESDDSCRDELPRLSLINYPERHHNTRKNMLLFSQDMIWGNDQDNNEFQKKLNQERARSENKFDECETVYSHSLKQTVGDSSLLKKLKNNNINGLKIKNLCQKEIQEFKFLEKKEKQLLSQKVRLYQLRRQKNPVIYSLELVKFFISKQKDHLLEKAKLMKIKEEQLLNIQHKNVGKLQFLSSDDKEDLLGVIKEFKLFCNEKQFCLINAQIDKFVSPQNNKEMTKEITE